MIEEALMQYGVLGVWTLTLLGERYIFNQKMNKVIENNSAALNRNNEVIRKCQR